MLSAERTILNLMSWDESTARAMERAIKEEYGDEPTTTELKAFYYSLWYTSGIPDGADVLSGHFKDYMQNYYKDKSEGKDPSKTQYAVEALFWGVVDLGKGMFVDPVVSWGEMLKEGFFLGRDYIDEKFFSGDAYKGEITPEMAQKLKEYRDFVKAKKEELDKELEEAGKQKVPEPEITPAEKPEEETPAKEEAEEEAEEEATAEEAEEVEEKTEPEVTFTPEPEFKPETAPTTEPITFEPSQITAEQEPAGSAEADYAQKGKQRLTVLYADIAGPLGPNDASRNLWVPIQKSVLNSLNQSMQNVAALTRTGKLSDVEWAEERAMIWREIGKALASMAADAE